MNCCSINPHQRLEEGLILPFTDSCPECRRRFMKAYKDRLKARRDAKKGQAREARLTEKNRSARGFWA